MENLRLATVQMESKPLDKTANLDKIEYLTARAARDGVRLVLFPECSIPAYMPLGKLSRAELLEIAETVPKGPSTRRLLSLARQFQIAISAGLIERDEKRKMYKCQVVVTPNGRTIKYRKLHPFVHPALSPGNRHVTFDYLGWRFGILICYDNNQPENGRILATKGVQVLLAPHQTGGFPIRYAEMGIIDRHLWEQRKQNPEALRAEFQGPKGREWLMRWLPSRAYDNGCYLVFSNGVGPDGEEIRTGNAMILDPHGRILAESREIRDHLVVGELCPAVLSHNLGRLHLSTRRPVLYKTLAQPMARRTSTKTGRDAAVADRES